MPRPQSVFTRCGKYMHWSDEFALKSKGRPSCPCEFSPHAAGSVRTSTRPTSDVPACLIFRVNAHTDRAEQEEEEVIIDPRSSAPFSMTLLPRVHLPGGGDGEGAEAPGDDSGDSARRQEHLARRQQLALAFLAPGSLMPCTRPTSEDEGEEEQEEVKAEEEEEEEKEEKEEEEKEE
jgi:hypothetical protein